MTEAISKGKLKAIPTKITRYIPSAAESKQTKCKHMISKEFDTRVKPRVDGELTAIAGPGDSCRPHKFCPVSGSGRMGPLQFVI